MRVVLRRVVRAYVSELQDHLFESLSERIKQQFMAGAGQRTRCTRWRQRTRAVADVLSEICSAGLVPYRYGAEELCVVMLGASEKDAVRFAEVIRARVASLSFPKNPDLKVTISLGVAVARHERHGQRSPRKKADAALYSAKVLGATVSNRSEVREWDSG